MTETRIGTVTHYYSHLHVAGVTITDNELHTGDTIHVKGHTSDFEQKVEQIRTATEKLKQMEIDCRERLLHGARTCPHVAEPD